MWKPKKFPAFRQSCLSLFRKSSIRVEDIMVHDVKYITLKDTYRDLKNLLLSKLRTFPLVKSEGTHPP